MTITLTNSKAPRTIVVPKDSIGVAVVATVRDDAGAVVDLSGATGSLLFHSSTLEGVAVRTDAVATFTTDGTDGKIQFALAALDVATVRSLRCEFEVQGLAGVNLITDQFVLKIVARAKVA